MPKVLKFYRAPLGRAITSRLPQMSEKLKKEKRLSELTKIKKAIKALNMQQSHEKMQVLNIPCMGLCPRNGVTVRVPSRGSGQLFIIRSEGDLEKLHSEASYTASPSLRIK